jgi:hypothetical protein
MEYAKCLRPIGYLTLHQIYTVVGKPDRDAKWLTVVDDQGNCATYSADRFEPVLAPQVAPDFRQMKQIADEVKITQSLVEAFPDGMPHGQKYSAEQATTDIKCPVVEQAKKRAERSIDDINAQRRLLGLVEIDREHVLSGLTEETDDTKLILDRMEKSAAAVSKLADEASEIVLEQMRQTPAPSILMSPQQIIDFQKAFPDRDENLYENEWHVIFGDYRNREDGLIQKRPWGDRPNMTPTLVVVPKAALDAVIHAALLSVSNIGDYETLKAEFQKILIERGIKCTF